MTYSNSSFQQTKKSLDALITKIDDNTVPPQKPGGGEGSTKVFTNPATGATYRWIEKTAEKHPDYDTKYPQLEKNSWVFYPEGVEIDVDAFDPTKGNLWVDENDAFMVYVYNNNDIPTMENGWYSLTSKKKGWDHFVIQTGASPADLIFVDPNQTSEDVRELLPGVILKQGFIYFNTTSNDLYVWNGEYDDYGNVIDGSGNVIDSDAAWVQITRKNIQPSPAEVQIESKYEELQRRVAELERTIASL